MKTWSRGTNSHLPLAINVTLNLFIIIQLLIESFDALNSRKLNVEKSDARTQYTTRAFEGILEMSTGKNVECLTGNENKLAAPSRQTIQS